MKLKYSLHPGPVRSQHDDDRHYVTACMLADLYGVSMSECAVGSNDPRLIHLYPRYDGNYTLPIDPPKDPS